MAESTVSTVLGNMADLVVEETKFLGGVTLQVTNLKHELTQLQGYLEDFDTRCRSGNDAGAASLVRKIRDAAYEAESVIQTADHMEKRNRLKSGFMGAISRYARLPTDLIALRDISVKIGCVRRKLSEIFASIEHSEIVNQGNTVSFEDESPQDLSVAQQIDGGDVAMVGFQDDYREIVEKLVDKENNTLSVISIVAVGGAGKTTLARKIYNSSRVAQHFEVVAWVTASPELKGINLLKDIAKQLVGDIDEYLSIDGMDDEDLSDRITELLFEKRYLVVLDDLCEVDTWEEIQTRHRSFPDATNGSRVLLTTQKEAVAYNVKMSNYVHSLKRMDEEESWELFSSKALQPCNKSAIQHVHAFEDIGRKITRKCKGLPLAVEILGAYLSRNLNLETWTDVLLGWPPSTKTTSEIMWYVLSRSYKGMTNQCLRSCLLCLAAFPKDHIISVPDIVQLWIVESFIPHTTMHTQEEAAYKYVTELAERSFVRVVATSKAHGRIEEIKICDTVRSWCLEEARKDGFIGINDKTTGQAGASSSDTMLFYRSSFQNFSGQTSQATIPNLRTLFGFGLSSVIFDPKLTLLRVIHIEDSSLKNFSMVIRGCAYLRYLKLKSCKDVSIPSSIGKLLYLQTVDLWCTGLDKVVPNSLWNIPTLRHVHVRSVLPPPARSLLQPKKVQTLALDLFSAGTKYPYGRMMIFLEQMTQLTSLSLMVKSMSTDMIKILANMPHLVDLSMYEFDVLDKLPESHRFPQKLRYLRLCAGTINQDPMEILEKLPCLVVLVLKGYRGQTMSCSTQGFPELQVLELATNSYTEEWRIQLGSMPKLSILKLGDFSKMSELPKELLHTSLSCLKLTNTSPISPHDSTLKELEQRGCEVDDNYMSL